MSVRTTLALIKQISEVDASLTDVSSFITAANSLINRVCLGITEADAIVVETWLSAHFIAIRDPKAASEGVSGISVGYQGQTGMALDATLYGQQAMLLDPTGALASWSTAVKTGRAARKVKIGWLGSEA